MNAVVAVPLEHPDIALKKQFAALLLEYPKNDLQAAIALFPDDMNMAMMVVRDWKYDEFVLAEKAKLLSKGVKSEILPEEAEFAKEILDTARSLVAANPEVSHKFYNSYMEMVGYKKKADAVGVNVNVQNVMVVKDHGTDDEWRVKARAQQARLVNDDFTKH